MSNLYRRFGNLLAVHRKNAGMRQEDLASAADMSVDMIARIEAGKTGVRFPTIEKLSKALQIDPAELFTHELPAGAVRRSALTDLTARLAKLSDKDLERATAVLEAALKLR
jgi:transcriptional regulator with XRE-family HTH domain